MKKKVVKLSTELEVDVKYDFVIIKRPGGLITLSRSTFDPNVSFELAHRSADEGKNKKLKGNVSDNKIKIVNTKKNKDVTNDMPILDIDVDYRACIAWSEKLTESTQLNKTFNNRYSGIDMDAL